MITKSTYGEAGVFKPDLEGVAAKKLAGPCEIAHLKLSSGSGPAFVSIYDARDAGSASPTSLKWILDCTATANDAQDFSTPMAFSKGVYAVFEQGVGLNPVLCIERVQL